MSGGAAGGLGGAAIGSIVPGVGTALGATLGSLAGTGVQSLVGGGGGGSAGAGSSNPAANPNTASVYIPQAQQQADYSYQGVVNQLNNMGWAGLSQLGGSTPAAQTYPTAQQVVGDVTRPDIGAPYGSFGPYGDTALNAALGGMGMYQTAMNTPQYSPMASSNAMQALMQQYMPQLQTAYQNPQIAQAVNQITGISGGPLGDWAMQGAQQGAGLAQQGIGAAQPGISQLGGLAGQLPGQAQATANLIGQGVGPSAQMAQQGAWTAQTPANIPQSQQLAQYGGQTAMTPANIGQQQQLAGLAGMYGQTPANIPQQQQLAGMAGGLAPAYNQQLGGTYAPLQAASNQILQTGFDPQQSLFNQQANLVRQQQNAQNAMSGVGTSPYGAGVAGQAMQNFDINWANQQLGRQTQAAQAAQQIASLLPGFQQQGMANLMNAQQMQAAPTALVGQQLSNLLNAQQAQAAPTSLAGQQLANLSNAQGMQAAPTSLAGSQLANLANAQQMQAAPGQLGLQGLQALIAGGQGAQGLYGGALGLGTQAGQAASQAGLLPAQIQTQLGQNALAALTGQGNLVNQGVGALSGLAGGVGTAAQNQLAAAQALAQTGALPYQASMQQSQNALNALGQQQQLGAGLLGLPQQVLQDLQSYLGLGQSASQTTGYLGALGANQLAGGLGGIGTALTGLGGQALFGQGSGNSSPLSTLFTGTANQYYPGTQISNADYASLAADPNQALAAYNAANSAGSGGLFGWFGNLFGGGA